MESEKLYFQQLFEKESSTYTYLVADKRTKEAVLIDPVNIKLDRDLKLLEELGFNLKYVVETHVHADHITSASKLREKLGAKIVLGKLSQVDKADILLGENEKIKFGDFEIEAILTPGHTSGCTTFKLNNMLFTGDTLLVRSVGRTDFQQGDPELLYESIQKLYKLSDDTIVYPGHNYEGITKTSIEEEKKFNKFAKASLTKEEFVKLMNKRELPLPKKIKESVPANMVCGDIN